MYAFDAINGRKEEGGDKIGGKYLKIFSSPQKVSLSDFTFSLLPKRGEGN